MNLYNFTQITLKLNLNSRDFKIESESHYNLDPIYLGNRREATQTQNMHSQIERPWPRRVSNP